jgi:hypothetical protein
MPDNDGNLPFPEAPGFRKPPRFGRSGRADSNATRDFLPAPTRRPWCGNYLSATVGLSRTPRKSDYLR